MRTFAWIAAAIVGFMFLMTMAMSSAISGAMPSTAASGGFDGAVPGLDDEQIRNVTISLSEADRLRAPPLAVLSMVVSGLGESDFRVVPNGQGSGYCGVFQAHPRNIACDDTELQARSFLKGGLGFQAGGAIHLAKTRPNLTPGTIATMVEASGQPGSFYDKHQDKAVAIIAAWRSGAALDSEFGNASAGSLEGGWLAQIPGTSARCDKRIARDVVMLVKRYHLSLGDCYAETGHSAEGEHPLGLAFDAYPAPPYSWDWLDRMAHDLGWRESCASTGCAGQTGTAIRFVGWDGYPNHGTGHHIHLSWAHGPGKPAESVQVLSD